MRIRKMKKKLWMTGAVLFFSGLLIAGIGYTMAGGDVSCFEEKGAHRWYHVVQYKQKGIYINFD